MRVNDPSENPRSLPSIKSSSAIASSEWDLRRHRKQTISLELIGSAAPCPNCTQFMSVIKLLFYTRKSFRESCYTATDNQERMNSSFLGLCSVSVGWLWQSAEAVPSRGRFVSSFGHYVCVSCSVVADSATPWTSAHQAPLSTEFSRQEYWSGLPFPSPGDPPNPEIKPRSPAFQGDYLPCEPSGS